MALAPPPVYWVSPFWIMSGRSLVAQRSMKSSAAVSMDTEMKSSEIPVASSSAWNMAASEGSEISFRNGGHACIQEMVYSSSTSGYSIGGLPSNSAVSASPLEASPASADSATAGSSGDAAASGDSAVPFPASAASSAEASAAETELSPAGAAELPQPANAVSIMATASRIASKLFSYVDPPLLFICPISS